MVPEMLNAKDIVYPHENPKAVIDEPHYRRVW